MVDDDLEFLENQKVGHPVLISVKIWYNDDDLTWRAKVETQTDALVFVISQEGVRKNRNNLLLDRLQSFQNCLNCQNCLLELVEFKRTLKITQYPSFCKFHFHTFWCYLKRLAIRIAIGYWVAKNFFLGLRLNLLQSFLSGRRHFGSGLMIFIVGGLAEYIYLAHRLHYKEDMQPEIADKIDRITAVAYFGLFSVFMIVYFVVYVKG